MKKLTSIPLYWKCQVIGWLTCSLYWAFTGPVNANYNFLEGLLDFIGDFTLCIFITHSYRNFALSKNWNKLPLNRLVLIIIPVIFLLGLIFLLIISLKLYLVRVIAVPGFHQSFSDFFKSSYVTLFVTGVRLMSIWVLAYHMYHYSQREINIAKENARLSVIAKEAQLNNLSAQLNPHFFFNSLNNIKFLVKENPESARRAIDLLSELLRNSLYRKDDRLTTVREEIGLVNDYLELEKLRFEERLRSNIIVDEKLLDILIPPFTIQSLVENALKHGIDKRKDGGEINITIEKKSVFLKIQVQNPGTIVINENHSGVGLENLKERLHLQFNGMVRFSLSEADEKVSATILIPVNE